MKLFKLIPAALALFALASCSTDEIESTQFEKQNVASKGDLRINFDPIEGELGEAVATRAMADRNFRGPQFEDDDLIFVYDEKMHSTDVYHFDAEADKKAFYFAKQFTDDTKLITGEGDNIPAFGVFVGAVERNADDFNSVKKYPKGWVARNIAGTPTCVDVEIPHVMTYKQNGNLYGFDIPAFGVASFNSEEEYIQLDHFRFLTGILRVKLTNAFGNASFLKIENAAGKPLSGKLTATLDGENVANSKLEIVDEDYLYYPELYIDLRNVPSNLSYIYIPVVAGLDGDIDGVKLWYTDNRITEDIVGDDELGAINWTTTGMEFPGIEFEANHAYAGSYAFELAHMSPKKVSDLLAQYKASSSKIDLNVTTSFEINSADADIDNVIYVPQLADGVNVNITLGDEFPAVFDDTDPDNIQGWSRYAGSAALQIKDLDPEHPFKGTITINAGEKLDGYAAQQAALRVDLVEGTAVFAGKFSNPQNINPVSGNVQIGDGKTATSGIALSGAGIGDDLKSFTVADKAEFGDAIDCSKATNKTETIIINGKQTAAIYGGPVTKTITVGTTGVLNGDINTDATPAAKATDRLTITVDGEMVGDIDTWWGPGSEDGGLFVDVNVAGYVDGGIDLNAAVKGTLTLTTACADPTDQVVTGNVWTRGNVDIKLAAEGEAIAGTLYMYGSNKTIDLVQGYVNKIKVDVDNAGQWENKFITLKLDDKFDDGNAGLTAFKDLRVEDGNFIKYTKSIWNGKKIAAGSSYNGVKTSYYNQKAAEKDLKTFPAEDGVVYKNFAAGNTSLAVFTAAQLASLNPANQVRLMNDIDLNNKEEWVGLEYAGDSFWAFNHKIENLSLKNSQGLFRSTTGNGEIFDLQIVNPTGDVHTKDAGKSMIGAVVGANQNTLAIKNVKVTGLSVTDAGHKTDNSKTLIGVGGLVGFNFGKLTLEKDAVSGSITGFWGLGGLVGVAAEDVSIKECTAAITIAPALYEGATMNINYAKFGGFIGTAISTSVDITLDAITGCTLTQSVPDAVTAKMYISDTSAGVGSFYQYKRTKDYIGYCGAGTVQNATTVGTITVGTGNNIVGGLFADEATAKANANYAKFISYMQKK